MSVSSREPSESDEERQMQRAIEASLQTSVRSQLTQGNSSTRRRKWEALRTSSTDASMTQDQSLYSSTHPEHSGYRETDSHGADTADGEEKIIDPSGPKIPNFEEVFQSRLRAIDNHLSPPTDLVIHVKMTPSRPNIDDYIAEMQQTRAIDLVRLDMPDGDTFVFIDAPAQQPDQDDYTYAQIQARYFDPFRVRSSTLKSLNSPFFDAQLSPTAQFRALRRRKLVNNLPCDIKYVIDLTPPNEGDDAAKLTANLSCKLGVRQWGLSSGRWNISAGLVGGQDELSRLRVQPNQNKPTNKIQWIQGKATVTETVVVNDNANPPGLTPRAAVHGSLISASGSSPVKEASPAGELLGQPDGVTSDDSDFQLPADYTPIRHRFAIERVLNGIEGQDPKIDSAVKLWSTFAAAKYVGIRESLLTDYIVRWLRAPPNTYFMEVQPEVTLKIAEGLHCQAVGRDAFAILVGEAALAVVCEGRNTDPHYSVHGRRKEYVKELHFEPWLTRIQYARDHLVERVKAQFEELTSTTSTWIEELPEVRKLLEQTHASMQHRTLYADLVKALKMYVRGAIYYLLCSNYVSMPGPVEDRGTGTALFPQTQFCSTWNLLTHHERVFTRAFWDNLHNCRLIVSNVNYGVLLPFKYSISGRPSDELVDLAKAGVFKNIYPSELCEMISAYRSLDDHGTKATANAAYSSTHIGLGSGSRKEAFLIEKWSRPLASPPIFNIAYRPKKDEKSSFLDFSAADDDWRVDGPEEPWCSSFPSSDTLSPSHSWSDTTPLVGEMSIAQSVFHSQQFPKPSHHEDPYTMPSHDEVFYDYESESPSKRRRSKKSTESISRFQAQHEERAEENKRQLAELHKRNRSQFGERQQQSETLCNGSMASSPYRDIGSSAENGVPIVHGSPEKNLLSARQTPRQGFFEKAPPVSEAIAPEHSHEVYNVHNGQKIIFASKHVSSPSQAQKVPNANTRAYESGMLGYDSDTLESATYTHHPEQFNLKQFFVEVERHLHSVANNMLASPDVGQRDSLDLALTNTLVCLTESELKFLPLWAGGNDDGSNGVFNEEIPLAEYGFSTAGPQVHTGSTGSTASSDFELLHEHSTVHTSTAVNDGYSDTLERRRVYDEDSEWGAVRANKSFGRSAQTLNGNESNADSESTWDDVITPAGADDIFMADGEEASGSTRDKGKGKMIDFSTFLHSAGISTGHMAEEKQKAAAIEEEDYSNIFIEEDEDEDGSLGAISDNEDISMESDLEFWNDDDFNSEVDDAEVAAAELGATELAATELAATELGAVGLGAADQEMHAEPDKGVDIPIIHHEAAEEEQVREDAPKP
ncbi:hypothetical protein MMC11_003065 [Xylographa trunciseda]|nr:hypothetical protein [Xylographa trunciseda]